MKLLTAAIISTSLLCAVGCDNDFKDKPKAKVGQEVKKGEATAEKAAAKGKQVKEVATAQLGKPLSVDAAASTIGWVGAKVTGKHEGSFKKFTGTASVAGDTLKSVEFEVEMDSVESDAAKLTEHLKSKDFFEVEKFSKATFKSKSITAKPAGGNTHEISGELTMRGVPKTITFPAKVEISPKSVRGSSEFTINRKDFGIEYAGMKDDLIKDDVLLKLTLVFPRG